MASALFISPHLDDAAFSCGGTISRLAGLGWRVVVSTTFTASVPAPQGFALLCQTDKGIPASEDYMALRRAEDAQACAALGAEASWLDNQEAPHRGYESAPELFSTILPGDEINVAIEQHIINLIHTFDPDLVFLPQGLGGHVDHLQVINAVGSVMSDIPDLESRLLYYRDTPYVLRNPDATPMLENVTGMREIGVGIKRGLPDKLRACGAYTSQLDFQFGGVDRMREALEDFSLSEGKRLGVEESAEAYLGYRIAVERLKEAVRAGREV